MNWYKSRPVLLTLLFMLACLGSVSLALPKQKPNTRDCQAFSCQPVKIEQIQQVAQKITVQVRSKELLGSGTLIKKEGQVYTVVTSAHVLKASIPPYQIQTPDGRIHQATTVSKAVEFGNNDLDLLQFSALGRTYELAKIADSQTLMIGDKVFVGGFKSSFVFTTGKVSLLLPKSLQGGYQIGYTNNVQKGMSGAALLNEQGEVVGINGLHKDPIWDAPESYEDGSEPSQALQKQITHSSFAIPIKTVIKLLSKILSPNY